MPSVSTVSWRATVLTMLVAGAAPGIGAPRQPARPVLTIVSPGEGAYISGSTLLKATVDPADQVATVVFFADGKQVCSVARAPFQCGWDAGPTVIEHPIRVVVRLSDGGQVVKTARTSGAGVTESVDVDVVQVSAAVTDGGKFVHGLPKTAFRVFEDGVAQTITSLTDSTAPLDLVVAVDVSSSMRPSLPKVKEAVKAFLAAVPAKDSVTLIGFNHTIAVAALRETKAAERMAAVDQLTSWGMTGLYDVLVHSTDVLGSGPGRKAIVVFSDGEDQGSRASIEQAERRLQESDATLYMIGQGRGVSESDLKQVLLRLATPTGGRAVFSERIETLKDVFADVLQELSNQYLIGYPPSNDKRDGTLRRITVHVDGGYRVRARQSYRARSK
jgi:Ca-activated chloride channel homolog